MLSLSSPPNHHGKLRTLRGGKVDFYRYCSHIWFSISEYLQCYCANFQMETMISNTLNAKIYVSCTSVFIWWLNFPAKSICQVLGLRGTLWRTLSVSQIHFEMKKKVLASHLWKYPLLSLEGVIPPPSPWAGDTISQAHSSGTLREDSSGHPQISHLSYKHIDSWNRC